MAGDMAVLCQPQSIRKHPTHKSPLQSAVTALLNTAAVPFNIGHKKPYDMLLSIGILECFLHAIF